MTGHIKKRGSKYSIVVDIGRDQVTGKRHQKWYSGYKTKKAAEEKLAEILHQIATGAYIEPSKLTVADYLAKWLAEYAKDNVSGKTFERYEEICKNAIIPSLGSIHVPRLQPLHIQNFYRQQIDSGRKKPRKDGPKGLNPRTVIQYHRILHKALAQAVRWNLLTANPADRVVPPKMQAKEVQPIDEMRSVWLIEVAEGSPCYVPIVLALYTGMRRGEILALRWQDVNLNAGYLRVERSLEQTRLAGATFKLPKSKKSRRTISLPVTVVETLKAHRAEQEKRRAILGEGYQALDLVCCREDGALWVPSAFTASYRSLLALRHLDGPNFHALRHSHASHLLRSGVSAKVISERLGHSTVGFTLDQYVHVLPGMQEEAAVRIETAMNAAKEKLPKHVS